MRVVWIVPAAWWGLLLLAVPIALHLLQQPRLPRVPLPSLRFVPRAPLAAARRRVVHDLPLLLVRMSTIAAAVLALAAPVVVTAGRARAWDGRVARAVIVDRSTSAAAADVAPRSDDITQREVASAFRGQVFPAAEVAAAVPQALRWLDAQPPAAREIVVVTDGQLGTFDRWPAAALPHGVGVRVTTVEPTELPPALVRLDAAPGGGHAAIRVPLRLELKAGGAITREEPAVATPLPPLPVTLHAAGAAQTLVDAVWAGVLDEGLRVRGPERWVAVEVAWGQGGRDVAAAGIAPSAPDAVRQAGWAIVRALGDAPGVTVDASAAGVRVQVARAPEPSADERLLRAVRDVAVGQEDVGELEPRRLDAVARAAVERPHGPSPAPALGHVEATDARWAWAAVMLLLCVEWWLRRPARVPADIPGEVARVA